MSAPETLGRGVIIGAGAEIPEPWAAIEPVTIDEATLSDPDDVVDRLHRAWVARQPVVVSLAVDPGTFRAPQVISAPPFSIDPGLDLPLDRLHHLVWANNYDARTGELVWWWGAKAARVGATEGGAADVVLADGRDAWIDGGPRWSAPPLEAVVVESGAVDAGILDPIPAEQPDPASELAPDQLATADPSG